MLILLRYVELLVKNQLLVEYLHNVLRDERSMLKDTCVREFLELYYHKVASQLPVARMIYTINYGMHSKDDIDELCGDLFAIRIIAQATGVPTSVRKELRGSLRALQNKSERFRKESERGKFKEEIFEFLEILFISNNFLIICIYIFTHIFVLNNYPILSPFLS